MIEWILADVLQDNDKAKVSSMANRVCTKTEIIPSHRSSSELIKIIEKRKCLKKVDCRTQAEDSDDLPSAFDFKE